MDMVTVLKKYGLIIGIACFVGYSYFSGSDTSSENSDVNINLNQVLDVTIDTIDKFDKEVESNSTEDENFLKFSKELETNYNIATPALYTKPIKVIPLEDASLLAYEDANGNNQYDEGSGEGLYLIEIDGENSRIIASTGGGTVVDHHFSGTGLLAGYLIGSMLSRQRASGVNAKNLANKKTVTPKQSARARAGSGSHSRGK